MARLTKQAPRSRSAYWGVWMTRPAIGVFTVLLGGCGQGVSNTVVLVGAGDKDEATANLLGRIIANHPFAVVFTAGDNVYPAGSYSQFLNCYGRSWGRHKARTRPAPGNHDYLMPGAAGYFQYFGSKAGPKSRGGYYSYNIGNWHIVSLNSNIAPGKTADNPAKWSA